MMTVKQVAEYLQYHPMTIYRWTRARKIPCIRVGTMLRFDKASIDRWLMDKLGDTYEI